jgi:hypothetical protein
MSYLLDEAITLVPAIWIIGTFLKRTPKIADWTIPWILLVMGIVGSVLTLGLSVQSIVQGVLVTGVAVLGHQLLKQTIERN